jgi:uncharacterized MAPEG superfamily protein
MQSESMDLLIIPEAIMIIVAVVLIARFSGTLIKMMKTLIVFFFITIPIAGIIIYLFNIDAYFSFAVVYIALVLGKMWQMHIDSQKADVTINE